jgi:polysaccharide biosynthesis protein PslH
LTGLAERFDTTWVGYLGDLTGTHRAYPRRELEGLLPGVRVVGVEAPTISTRGAQVLSVVSPRSFEWGRYRTRAYEDALRSQRPALVHFDDPGVAQMGPLAGAVNVYAPHNVEHRIAGATVDATHGARRLFAKVEQRKVERLERRLWRAMDLSVAVSDADAAAFREGGAAKVLVCPNGVDPVERLPPARRDPGEPLRMIFVGLGAYRPNEYGVAWFVREVLPRVRAEVPAVLEVVGEPPPKRVDAEGVHYAGRVESLTDSYRRAHVAVIPLFHGSGTRLKAIEAMAYGRAVVSTDTGVAGLPVEPGRDYLRADDPPAFAAALADLASDVAPERMLAAARAAVERLLWPRIVARLADDYLEALAAGP